MARSCSRSRSRARSRGTSAPDTSASSQQAMRRESSSWFSYLLPLKVAPSRLLRSKYLPASTHDVVGIRDLRNPKTGSNVRVFYPSSLLSVESPPKIFRKGLPYLASGYLDVFLNAMKVGFLRPIFDLLLFIPLSFAPLNLISLPFCSMDAPLAASSAPLPLLVWSHGLTGTGDEHGLMATALAMRGYVVALVHHSDGSSALVDIESKASFTNKYFLAPDFKNYDTSFRQRQIGIRVSEVRRSESFAVNAGVDPNAFNTTSYATCYVHCSSTLHAPCSCRRSSSRAPSLRL